MKSVFFSMKLKEILSLEIGNCSNLQHALEEWEKPTDEIGIFCLRPFYNPFLSAPQCLASRSWTWNSPTFWNRYAGTIINGAKSAQPKKSGSCFINHWERSRCGKRNVVNRACFRGQQNAPRFFRPWERLSGYSLFPLGGVGAMHRCCPLSQDELNAYVINEVTQWATRRDWENSQDYEA